MSGDKNGKRRVDLKAKGDFFSYITLFPLVDRSPKNVGSSWFRA